jgi:hypothetical protein
MLAVTVCASKLYLEILPTVARRIAAAVQHYPTGYLLFVTDSSTEAAKKKGLFEQALPEGWKVIHAKVERIASGDDEKYKTESQLLIASLQGCAFALARKLGVDQCWNVEADVLPMPDCLRVLEWALQMPDETGGNYYDVALATYPNGLFIGGHGTIGAPIAEDFLPKERTMPDELRIRFEAFEKEQSEYVIRKEMPPKEWQEKAQTLFTDIRKCPAIGNVWKCNAEFGWSQRGWMDNAYPAIGRGSLVPVDWIGTGCVLLSKRALALANFEGYDGGGTQDLFLCWRRWYPAGLRMCCSTHSICDHVKHEMIEEKDADGKPTGKQKHSGKYIHYQAVHEQVGEQRGHLRCVPKSWTPI